MIGRCTLSVSRLAARAMLSHRLRQPPLEQVAPSQFSRPRVQTQTRPHLAEPSHSPPAHEARLCLQVVLVQEAGAGRRVLWVWDGQDEPASGASPPAQYMQAMAADPKCTHFFQHLQVPETRMAILFGIGSFLAYRRRRRSVVWL